MLTTNIMNIGLLKRRGPFHSPRNSPRSRKQIEMVGVCHEFLICHFVGRGDNQIWTPHVPIQPHLTLMGKPALTGFRLGFPQFVKFGWEGFGPWGADT